MKHFVLLFSCAVLSVACNNAENKEKDALPDLAVQIQKQGRFYSTEYQLHKIITQDDTKQLQTVVFNQKYSVELPLGTRSIAIPVEATVKAYVDFSDFTSDQVRRKGGKIEIILPDPQFEITSTRVDHDEVKQYVPLLRGNFTDKELTMLAQAGREAVVKDLPKLNLTESARRNTARMLIPMLAQMGFGEDQITVTFRKQFSASELSRFLVPDS